MAETNPKPNQEPSKEPTFEPMPVTQETQTERAPFGNSSSEDTGLRLSEETDSTLAQDSTTTATQSKPEVEPPPAEAVASLKNLFSSVDDALKQSQGLIGDVQKLLGDLKWKPIEGSDTRALTDRGDGGGVSTFGGFSMGSTPADEVMTKVYENGSVTTKFANGIELRFPPNGGFSEISINGEKPQRVSRSEGNIDIATASGNGFKLTQKADGTLNVEFEKPQPDGATSMTLYPNNPDGLKWTRNIPGSDGFPAHTVSGRTDKSKRAEFVEPFGTVRSALSSDNGDILVSSIKTATEEPTAAINELAPPEAETAEIVSATKSSAPLAEAAATLTDKEGQTAPAEKEAKQPTELRPLFIPLEQLPGTVALDGSFKFQNFEQDQTQLQALKGASSPLVAMAILAQLERIQSRQVAIGSGDLSELKLDVPSLDAPSMGGFDSRRSPLGLGAKPDKPSFGTKEEQRLLEELQSANSMERATRVLSRFNERQANGQIAFDTAISGTRLDFKLNAKLEADPQAGEKMMMNALQEAKTTEDFKLILGYVTRFGTPGVPAIEAATTEPSLFQVGFDRHGGRLPGFGGRMGTDMSPYLVNPSPLPVFNEVNLPFLVDSKRDPFGMRVLPARAVDQGPPAFQLALTLVDMMSKSTDRRGAETALDALSDLAKKGDRHAQTALAATVLALEGGYSGLAQIQKMNLHDNPILAPQLLNLSPTDREALRHRAMYELESQSGSDKPMSKEAMIILATTYETAKSTGNTDHVEKLSKVLKENASSDEGVSAFWRLHNLDKPQSDDLMKVFLDGMSKNDHGQFYFESLGRRAGEGNKEDIRLLGLAVSSGELNGEVSKTAMEGLQQAARSGQSDVVVSTLKDVYAKNGDNNRLHETLGAIASDGNLSDKEYESIKKMLRDGVASNDPELHNSAVQGLLRIPSKWTEADAKVLSESMSPVIAESLKDTVSKLEPERGKQLAQLIQDTLASNNYYSAEKVTSGVIALGALSDHAGPNAAQVIKDATTANRFSGGADQLTRAGVTSLMRMAGSMSPGSDAASELLKADGWKKTPELPMDRPEFRKELADFVTGDIARSDMSVEAKRIAYDSGFPQSIHRIFRDLGVGHEVLDKFVDKARTNYDDATIRDVVSRAALYNALPEDMRARLFMSGEDRTSTAPPEGTAGSAPPINIVKVIGQMATNELKEDSTNKLLLTPIEDKVQEIETAFAQEQRRVVALVELNHKSTNKELQELTQLTSQGVSAWRHFASLFGDSTLNDFTIEQSMGIGNYTTLTDVGKMYRERLGRLTGIDQALSTSLNAFQFEELKNSGNERESDLLAMQMLQKYGPTLSQRAPEVWKDLGMSPEQPSSKETVFQRLHREGLAQSPESPQIQFGTHEGMKMGIAVLSNNLDESKIDARAKTTLGLLALDTDPAFSRFSDTVNDLQGRLPALQELVTAGVNGTRREAYVGGVQKLVKDFQTVYDSMSKVDPKTGLTPAQEAKQSIELLKEALPNLDPDVRVQINERIKAMENMLEFLDPNSQNGKNMKLMFEQVNSNDFDESTFANWLKSDGLKTLGAIAVGVAAAVALAAAGPFVVAVAGVAGGIIGYEAMSEILFQVREQGIYDTGERGGSQIGDGVRGKLIVGANGQAEAATVSGALYNHGKDLVFGTGIALATMGVGTILGRAITSMRGSAVAGMNANASGIGRLAARVQQVEHAAEKVGGKALMQKWMNRFSEEFKEEIVEETIGKGAEAGLQEILGDVNPVMSVLASAVIANRKMGGGFELHPKRGGEVQIETEKGKTDSTMSALRDQLQADGLLVEWDGKPGAPMKVTTPEGEVLTLTAREAAATAETAGDTGVNDAARTEAAGNDTAGSEARLERVGLDTPALDTPGVDTQIDTREGGTDSGAADAPGANTPAQRQQQIQGLVQQLNQPNLDPAKKAELESQVKEVLVDQAKDYAKKLGLVVRDADGKITDYLINPDQISLVRGTTSSSFSWDNNMEVNIDDPELMSTLLHEMRHQKDYYGLTVQRLASEINGDHSFERRLQDEVFGELQTGDTRLVTSDGEFRISQGIERQIPQIRTMLSELRQEVKGQTFNSEQVHQWLQKNYPDAKVTFATQSELAQVMTRAVADRKDAGQPIDEPRKELVEHPELRKPLSNMLKEFTADRPNGQATPAEIEAFIANADLASFKNAGMTNSDVASLMTKELQHYQHVLALSSLTDSPTATAGDGSYTARLKQSLEASGNPKLFNELMRRAESTAASGSNVELQHLTRGIVEARLGIAMLPVEYHGTSPIERAAFLIEATQKLATIDRGGSEFDSAMDKVKFESRAQTFTKTFSSFRTETDPVKQAELWEKSQVAAKRLAEKLPDNDVGREMTERFLQHGLIDEVPPQFKNSVNANDFEKINDSTAMARLSPHANTSSHSAPRNNVSTALDSASSSSTDAQTQEHNDSKPFVQTLTLNDVITFRNNFGQTQTGESPMEVFDKTRKTGKVMIFLEEGTIPPPDTVPAPESLKTVARDAKDNSDSNTRYSYDAEGRVFEYKDGKRLFRNDMVVFDSGQISNINRQGDDYRYRPINQVESSIKDSVRDFTELQNKADSMSVDEFRSHLLELMSQAPEVSFSEEQLKSFNDQQGNFLTAINSPKDNADYARKNRNCMDCVAALFRSLQNRHILSVSDLKLLNGQNGRPVGINVELIGKDAPDSADAAEKIQIDWLVNAAGIDQPQKIDDHKLVPGIANESGIKDFAVVVSLQARLDKPKVKVGTRSESDPTENVYIPGHVFFGRVQGDGSIMYYDPQSGVRWSPQSVESFNPRYYPLKPRGGTK